MSIRMFLRYEEWANIKYDESLESILAEWRLHLLALENWDEQTIRKYQNHIRGNNPPEVVVQKFVAWLRDQGYEE